ncbi:hypothetical protein D3P06_03435 [Paracoccus aestuarii]|uniref:Uncharacterized protein n=1 Tax=Paracoccus aestuarii TaxID=453842 RepID=A0A419A128_9RHOB|nr:hypothetical protein [Paracoccus aestuarii]RJL06535.1 hypothetical protein D3P06_03435 [Paracoccus aestuarii]WCQ98840.1 hypothetical protein JHW48_13370 [Paracoccus aestuarii]
MTDDSRTASAEEKRALSKDELELADRARHPALGDLSDRELSDLVGLLRDRRNRARDIGDRQGREARGKADASGAAPAAGNAGTLTKQDYLSAALDRATAEREKRQGGGEAEGGDQKALSEKALQMKTEADAAKADDDSGAIHPDDPNADPGKGDLADKERRTAPSGALDHAGELPSRERSRTRY